MCCRIFLFLIVCLTAGCDGPESYIIGKKESDPGLTAPPAALMVRAVPETK